VEICKLSSRFLSMCVHLWKFSLAAQALVLPFAPPYLQPNATFYKGVNFASAGSGLLNTTNPGLVRFHFSCKFISVSTNIAYKTLWILKSYIMFATIIHQVGIGLDIMQSPLWWGYLESFRWQSKLLLQTLILWGYFDLEIQFASVHPSNYGRGPSNHDSNVF